MYNYNTTLDKLFNLLDSQNSDTIKCCLINNIADLVSKNYNQLKNENLYIQQVDNKDNLSNERDKLSDEIEIMKKINELESIINEQNKEVSDKVNLLETHISTLNDSVENLQKNNKILDNKILDNKILDNINSRISDIELKTIDNDCTGYSSVPKTIPTNLTSGILSEQESHIF